MTNLDQLDHAKKGNTNSSRDRKRPPLAKYWCFTFHDAEKYIELDRLDQILGSLGKFLHGHEICPETGRIHRQGFVQFNKRMRPSECKELPKQMHWEKCESSAKQNTIYVTKDWTDIRGDIEYNKPLKLIERDNFYQWQEDIVQLLEKECEDDRTIYWKYDEQGSAGKTCIAKWIHAKLPGVMIAGGKGSDIRHMVAARIEKTGIWPKIVLWNIPRTMEQFVSYEAIEQVKDGFFASGKYEGAEVNMNPPHVMVFANFYPDTSKMSMDRWSIDDVSIPA